MIQNNVEHPIFTILPLVQVTPTQDQIDISKISHLCSQGLDTCPPEDRVIAWLVLSHVLGLQPEEWKEEKENYIKQYYAFVNMFGIDKYHEKVFPDETESIDFGISDNKLMETIHGDLIRANHHITFFPDADETIEVGTPENILLPYHEHIRRMERILYIFAKVNGTLSYLQGFHEICCVIFCVYLKGISYFHSDKFEMETFVFYTFQQLISGTKLNELFTTQDKSSFIHNRLNIFMEILKTHIPDRHKIIQDLNIHPLFFCYRWLNLMFAQEYLIPDLSLIWDSLFSHFDELVDFESYVAVAQVKMIEDKIIEDDFINTLSSLQRISITNVKELLKFANHFWKLDHTHQQSSSIFDVFRRNEILGFIIPHL